MTDETPIDAVKLLEIMVHDGPGGTVAPPWLIPALMKIRNEVERLRMIEGRALSAKYHDDGEVRLIVKWIIDGEPITR